MTLTEVIEMRLYEFTQTDEAILLEGMIDRLPNIIQQAIRQMPGSFKKAAAIVALGAAGLSPAIAQDTQSYPTPTPVSRGGGKPAPNPKDFPVQDMGSTPSVSDDHPLYGKNPRKVTPPETYGPAPKNVRRAAQKFCQVAGEINGAPGTVSSNPKDFKLRSMNDQEIDQMYAQIKKDPESARLSDEQLSDAIELTCKMIETQRRNQTR